MWSNIAYTRTPHFKMLSDAHFNNSTNVKLKWKKFFYVWNIRYETEIKIIG
jgi:hypothetical protein